MPVDNRSSAEVVQDLVQNVQEILRSEVRLAKAEITQEAKKATRSAAISAGGAILAIFALGLLLWAAVYALSLALPLWAAALIMAVLVGIVAGIMLAAGRARMKQVHPKPETTIRSVKENVQWLKNQTR
jgi:ABC-type proline/glycine betaine transport system permease subunit